ncbi:MAG: hypothetical protein JSW34_06000 [Candidatus Zixiibacteriota bacterium]|nr:MAG: hypothetical protein JSW34_06000 [candidate division Zixibacteria bacterium]
MITFHEIKRVIQKMAVLSSHIGQLKQLLPQMIQLSEQIDRLNEDLSLERDQMTAKIRSVEVLGEILKTHVYRSAVPSGQGALLTPNLSQEDIAPSRLPSEDAPGGLTDATPQPDHNRSRYPSKLDTSSLII